MKELTETFYFRSYGNLTLLGKPTYDSLKYSIDKYYISNKQFTVNDECVLYISQSNTDLNLMICKINCTKYWKTHNYTCVDQTLTLPKTITNILEVMKIK